MRRASAATSRARTPIRRPDEMGAVAEGLNSMLERVGDFSAALQREVQRATEELRETNRQLAESAQRLFAARRELARSEASSRWPARWRPASPTRSARLST